MPGKPREIVRQCQTYEQRRELEKQGYLMVMRKGPVETYQLLFPQGLKAG